MFLMNLCKSIDINKDFTIECRVSVFILSLLRLDISQVLTRNLIQCLVMKFHMRYADTKPSIAGYSLEIYEVKGLFKNPLIPSMGPMNSYMVEDDNFYILDFTGLNTE